jgi:hypothetical protein
LVRATVYYGLTCSNLNNTASSATFSAIPVVLLDGLNDDTTYFFAVEAEDQAGNVTYDDNAGGCYTFTTPDIPNFFTELFEASDNDLDDIALQFIPNASIDQYIGCNQPITALPTDPTGGTSISLSDDDYEQITLTGGASVVLYGVSYSSFYVGSNGYLTFNSGDTDTTESLNDHFEQPRISALFDDLNPASGGTVSWKQLSDRVAVTFQNVPEYSVGGSNTFQYELFFDGTIHINYLSVSASDGLAGLSEGNGIDPDYAETDLSNMGPCIGTPPVAFDVVVGAEMGVPEMVSLHAEDEGLPIPPGAMTYIITSLPTGGTLADPNGGAITTVPYTLANYGDVVEYTSYATYFGSDAFEYKANDGGVPPEGGDSNIARVDLTIDPLPWMQLNYELSANPGWTTEGMWAHGQPTGNGSYWGDPTSGHTGPYVYGYNLDGDYANYMAPTSLTTPAIDMTHILASQLRFSRWLGVEGTDTAAVEISTDGTTWTQLWANTGQVMDNAWTVQVFDISAIADGQPAVYVRWVMGPTDGSYTAPGWNIDDVQIWGVSPVWCKGDADCSGAVDFADIEFFVAALSGEPAWQAYHLAQTGSAALCPYAINDMNGGGVEFSDIQPFIGHLGQPCDPLD